MLTEVIVNVDDFIQGRRPFCRGSDAEYSGRVDSSESQTADEEKDDLFFRREWCGGGRERVVVVWWGEMNISFRRESEESQNE